jgi:hypothetical protein
MELLLEVLNVYFVFMVFGLFLVLFSLFYLFSTFYLFSLFVRGKRRGYGRIGSRRAGEF